MNAIADLVARSSIAAKPRLVKLVIAGTRGITPTFDRISDAVDQLLAELDLIPCEIVSGNARGVDRAGEEWAAACGLPVTRFAITPAEWRAHGKFAGPRRNADMARYADALLAFWDGHSRGTKDMIQQMKGRKKPVLVVGGC